LSFDLGWSAKIVEFLRKKLRKRSLRSKYKFLIYRDRYCLPDPELLPDDPPPACELEPLPDLALACDLSLS
jgi:hypothetical protein